ncbi:hypothetical protein KAU32_08720 [bacterium]|nr:hypothetical protein [bacterium]
MIIELLYFIFLFIVPGIVIYRIFFSQELGIEKVPYFFVLSLLIYYIPCGLGFLFELSLKKTVFLVYVIYILLVMFFLFLLLSKKIKSTKIIPLNTYSSVTIGIALVYVILLYIIKGDIANDLNNLSIIYKSLFNNIVQNKNFVYSNEGMDPRFSFSLYHFMILIYSKISGLDPLKIWINLPAYMSFIAIFAQYCFGKHLLKKNLGGLLVVLVFIFHFGGIGYERLILRKFALADAIAMYTILPLALIEMIKYLDSSDKKYLWTTIIISLILTEFQIFYMILFYLSLFAIFLVKILLRDKSNRRVIEIFFYVTIFNIPYYILKWLSYGIHNPLHYDPQLAQQAFFLPDHLVFLTKNLFIIHPKFVFRQIYIMFTLPPTIYPITPLIAFLGILFFIKKIRRNTTLQFMISTAVLSPLLLLNPILVVGLSKIISSAYASKLSIFVPAFLILAFIILELKKKLKTKYFGFLLICFLLIISPKIFKNLVRDYKLIKNNIGVSQKSKLPEIIRYFNKNNIKGGNIISDHWTSYHMAIFTNNYAFAIWPLVADPNAKDVLQREKDYRIFFNEKTKVKEMDEILKKWGIKYIILNPYFYKPERNVKAIEVNSIENMWKHSLQWGPDRNFIVDKVLKLNAEQVFCENGYYIFKMNFHSNQMLDKSKKIALDYKHKVNLNYRKFIFLGYNKIEKENNYIYEIYLKMKEIDDDLVMFIHNYKDDKLVVQNWHSLTMEEMGVWSFVKCHIKISKNNGDYKIIFTDRNHRPYLPIRNKRFIMVNLK